MHILKRPVYFCLVFFLLNAAGWSQRREPFSTRVRSELVLVDLIVEDHDGNFVSDLRPEEVGVLEDGKRQEISFFQLTGSEGRKKAESMASGGSGPKGPARRISGSRLPSLQFSSATEAANVVVLIDLNTVTPNSLVRVKAAIQPFLKAELEPGDRILLATVERKLTISQNLTSDLPSILEALQGIEPTPDSASEPLSLERLTQQFDDVLHRVPAGRELRRLEQAFDEISELGRNFLVELEKRLVVTSEALSLLAGYLSTLPGRKLLVLFSGGYLLNGPQTIQQINERYLQAAVRHLPVVLQGRVSAFVHQTQSAKLGSVGGQEFSYRYLEEAIDRANRAQVSVYAVDSRGLVATSGMGDASQRGSFTLLRSGDYTPIALQNITGPQEFLVSLASGTGGIPFLNNSDLSRGVRRAFRDARRYYLIGYAPQGEKRTGKFRKIEVQVKRSGLRLRYRKGYLDLEPGVSDGQIANAFKFPELFRTFALDVELERTSGKVDLTVFIPTAALQFEDSEKGRRCVIEVYGGLFDEEGLLLENKPFFSKGFQLNLSAEQLAGLLRRDNVTTMIRERLPPQARRLLVVVRQGPYGRISTAVVDLQS